MLKRSIVILGLLLSSSLSVAKPQEIILKKQNLSTQQIKQLCDLLPESCRDQPVWYLYTTVKQDYYLIDHLKFYQLGFEKQKFNIQQHWDFSSYRPQTQQPRWASHDEGDEIGYLSIFPKLFALNETDFALGIVQTWTEGYSGGGMEEEVVDFLKLKPKGQYEQVFQNIPLSMYRMIRACFSEQQYIESKGKCHDDYSLDLQIVYVKPMTWQLKYYYQVDYSPASDSKRASFKQHKNYLLQRNSADAIQLPKIWLEH